MRSLRWLLPSVVVLSAACSLPNSHEAGESPQLEGPPSPTVIFDPGNTRTLALGPVVKASRQVPAISGGTLAVGTLGASEVAVASDPETDTVWVAPINGKSAPVGIDLGLGAEPGRVVIAGEVARVLLRGTGELATIDLASNKVTSRVPICPAPRGLDYEASSDTVAVACMDGQVLLFDATSGQNTARFQLDRDLRDVVLRGQEIVVSRFRSSELVVLYRDGRVRDQQKPPAELGASSPFSASVAWRTVGTPDGGVMVLHQQATTGLVQITQPGGYGSSGCGGGVVHPALSVAKGGVLRSTASLQAALVVDVAVAGDGRVALAVASKPAPSDGDSGAAGGPFGGPGISGPCGQGDTGQPLAFDGVPAMDGAAPSGQPTDVPEGGDVVAVAFSPSGRLISQHRAPAMLDLGGVNILLGAPAAVDTGHTLFHSDSGVGLACASCHPEGGDDGRVWNFEKLGARRTQPLQGGLKGSEPFHWSGDMSDFDTLVNEVFVHRMGGPKTDKPYDDALLDWMDTIPALPATPVVDTDAVTRGQALFHDATVGCATCHNGARLSNNATVNVGTGGDFQVPTLRGLAYRAPFLHDGTAATLKERFDPKGGGDLHGTTSQLNPGQINDLVAYLETL